MGPERLTDAITARVTFGERLDEASRLVRTVTGPRLLLYPLATLVGLLIVPWPLCLAWLAIGLAVEGAFAISSAPARAGPRGRPVMRVLLASSLIGTYFVWLSLGLAFWLIGGAPGQAVAVILSLVVVSLGALLIYGSPAVFVLAGAAPLGGAMLMVTQEGLKTPGALFPVGLACAIGLTFLLGVASRAPSFQVTERQLKESLKQYRILADNVTDLVARTDMEGRHIYLSPSAQTVLGYAPEALLGRAVEELVEPESVGSVDEAVARMNADPAHPQVFTVRFRHAAGHLIWLQIHAKLLFEDGVPVGTVHVSRDITEQVEVAQALQEAKAEAEAANRAKADFLANVSHEIRTPMNGVLGALQLLDGEDVSPEGRELMRRASDGGRMLSQLLNDVLDFSKIEAGQLELAPEPMSVVDGLKSVIALLEPEARGKGLELRTEILGDDLWIVADPLRLRQAMFNLLGNAIKFTSRGHVTARLTLTPAAGGDRQVRLEVEDTGIGIAPEAQVRLFERFRQAESSTARRFGGTGLGLSITRALVEMMGGYIGVKSRPGEGSVFWLDVVAPAAEPVSTPDAEGRVLAGVRLLLVEDNPTNRLVARTMLTRLGAEVDEAEDGVGGVRAARQGAYDLILMDVQMPHMDGVEATRAIRGLGGEVAGTPIIGLTANVMVHQKEAYLAAGMNGVVAKPISAAALLGEIARLTADDGDAALAS
jgi:PAS domain S-box-containing protein